MSRTERWTIIGVGVAVVSAVIAFLAWWFPQQAGGGPGTTSTVSTAVEPSTPVGQEPSAPPNTVAVTPEQPVVPRVAPETPIDSPALPSQAQPAILAVDHIQIFTWAYNPAGPPNAYIADNNGGKKVRISWESSAGGFDVNGGCTSTVHVEGNGYDHAESSSNCSDSMGTYFDVPKPGIYTATVTTYQTSGHQYSDSLPFTIQ
jgi:hypothetical protein